MRAIMSIIAFVGVLAGIVQGYYAVVDHWFVAKPSDAAPASMPDQSAPILSGHTDADAAPRDHKAKGDPVAKVGTAGPAERDARPVENQASATAIADDPTAGRNAGVQSTEESCLNARQSSVADGPLLVNVARCARIAPAYDKARYGTRLAGWITNNGTDLLSVATVSDYYFSSLRWEHHIGSWSATTSGGAECLVKDAGNGNLPVAGAGIFRREQSNATLLNSQPNLDIQPGQTIRFSVMFYCTEAGVGDTISGSMRFYTAATGERWQQRTISFDDVRIADRVD